MRSLYRERRYFCGNYLEVNIFPVFAKQKGRGKRKKPTSEVQARLNEHNAEQALIRILNANFTGDDVEIHLTYADENLPETPDEAKRDFQNYIRRVKRAREKLGLPPLKYVLVPAGGIEGTRYHAHITMSGGLDRSLLEELWGYGYANCRRLQFNENGVEGLARYCARQFSAHREDLPFGKRWSGSRNLTIPEAQDRDGKIKKSEVAALALGYASAYAHFEEGYDGWTLSDCRPFYNDVNGGYYLHVRMYRKDTLKAGTNKRKTRRKKERQRNETFTIDEKNRP